MKKSLFFITLILVFALSSGVAGAHATPVSYSPDNFSVLEKSPSVVEIEFNERVEEGASSIDVYDPDGKEVDDGEAYADPNNSKVFKSNINPEANGVYTVAWRVVSQDDGHFTKGAYSFRLGEGNFQGYVAEGQSKMEQLTSTPQAVTTWIEIVGQSIFLGALVLLIFLLRPLIRGGKLNLSDKQKEKIFKIMAFGAVLIVLGSASYMIFKAFSFQDFSADDFVRVNQDTDFTPSLISFAQTKAGSSAALRMFLGLSLLGLLYWKRDHILNSIKTTKTEWVLLGIFALMAFSRARVSHAAASEFFPNFSVFINFVHLIAKDLIIGFTVAAFFMAAPIFYKESIKKHTLRILNKVSGVAVAIGGATGTYIIWLHLKDFSNIFETEWGSRFSVLILFSLGFLFFVIYHFLVSRDDKFKLAGLGSTVSAQMLLGLMVLFFSSYLIVTTPPYVVEKYEFEKNDVNQGAKVSLSVHPYESNKFLVEVLSAERPEPVSIESILVKLSNREKGINSLTANLDKRSPGRFVFNRDFLSAPGEWEVDVGVSREKGYDINSTFDISYPDDVDASLVKSSGYSFGLLGITSSVAAFTLIYLGFFIHRNREENFTGDRRQDSSGAVKGVLVVTLFSVFVFLIYSGFLKTDFQKMCEENNHSWSQARPMRSGVPTSLNTVTGCSVETGMHHFANFSEYEYFIETHPFVVLN